MANRKATGRPTTGDLIAFLGVLAAGVALICIGHVSPAALAGVTVGLGTLYTA
jgi:hypothetical protein